MAAFLAQKGMQFIDTLMMGWIGPDALAAGALGTSIFITILLFCMGTLSAVGIFIARAKGSKELNEIKVSLENGIYLILFLSLPCMAIMWWSPALLLMIGEDPLVVEKVSLLLHGLVWGFPGYLLFLLFREFISAFSYTRVVMIIALSSIPLTFVGNYILIYGKYGFPQLGIAGIGYAGALIMWFMFICAYVYTKTHPHLKSYVPAHFPKFSRSRLYDMIYIGAPSGGLLLLEAGMFLSAAIMMGYFGVDVLAAHQIAMQCASLAYTIPFALGMSTALLVGHAVGAKDIITAKRLAYFGLGIGIAFSAVTAIFFIFTPERLVKLFISDSTEHFNTINQLAISFLILAGIFQCFDAVQTVANGALRGLKDTWIPMLLSIGCYWLLGVSSALYLAFYTRLGAAGVWVGLTLGIISIATVLTLRLFKKIKVEQLKYE